MRITNFLTILAIICVLAPLLVGCGGSKDEDSIHQASEATEIVLVTVTPTTAEAAVGNPVQYMATATYSDGSTSNVTTKVNWESSDEEMVTIDHSGNATMNAKGDVTITATMDDFSGSAILSVLTTTIPSGETILSVSPWSASVKAGESTSFQAILISSDGTTQDVSTEVTWASDVTEVAEIASGGKASSLSAGTTTIAATLGDLRGFATLTVDEVITSIIVVDGMGNEVEVPYPVRRIASFNPAATEVIWALGADDRIVGIDMFSKWNKEFFTTLSTKSSTGMVPMMPDYEKIISLRPNIVIAYADPLFNYPLLEEKMDTAGIKVLRLDLYKPETFAEEVAILGKIVGRNNLAEEYIDYAESYARQIEDRVKHIPQDDRVKVYYEWFMPYVAYGEGTGGHQLVMKAGGTSIFSREGGNPLEWSNYNPIDESTYATLSPEWIIDQRPDVIIKDYMNMNDYMAMGKKPLSVGYTSQPDTGEMEAAREGIMGRPGFSVTEAVQKGKVYTTPFCGICLSPRWAVALGYMAQWFYPELVQDLDPQAFHAEWLEKWHSLEYQGVFFYPEIS